MLKVQKYLCRIFQFTSKNIKKSKLLQTPNHHFTHRPQLCISMQIFSESLVRTFYFFIYFTAKSCFRKLTHAASSVPSHAQLALALCSHCALNSQVGTKMGRTDVTVIAKAVVPPSQAHPPTRGSQVFVHPTSCVAPGKANSKGKGSLSEQDKKTLSCSAATPGSLTVN